MHGKLKAGVCKSTDNSPPSLPPSLLTAAFFSLASAFSSRAMMFNTQAFATADSV